MNGIQQSLDSYSPEQESNGTAQGGESQRQCQSSSTTSSLDTLYADMAEHAESIPGCIGALDCVTRLDQPEHYANTRLPETIPGLPMQVGEWVLAARDDGGIYYAAKGPAYKDDYGKGRGFVRSYITLNDSGANRDGRYHRFIDGKFAFDDLSVIDNADLNATGYIKTGLDTSKGGWGYRSGSKADYGSIYDAVVDLLVALHYTPTPISSYIDVRPATDWTLTKLSINSAVWEAPAPSRVDRDKLRLRLGGSSVLLSAKNSGQGLNGQIRTPVPVFDTPETAVSHTNSRTELVVPAAGIPITESILSRSPEEVWQKASALSGSCCG